MWALVSLFGSLRRFLSRSQSRRSGGQLLASLVPPGAFPHVEFLELLLRDDPYIAAFHLVTQVHVSVVPDLPAQQILGIQYFRQPAWFRMIGPLPLVLGQHFSIDALDDFDDGCRVVAIPGLESRLKVDMRKTQITILLREIARVVGNEKES